MHRCIFLEVEKEKKKIDNACEDVYEDVSLRPCELLTVLFRMMDSKLINKCHELTMTKGFEFDHEQCPDRIVAKLST